MHLKSFFYVTNFVYSKICIVNALNPHVHRIDVGVCACVYVWYEGDAMCNIILNSIFCENRQIYIFQFII